MRWMIGLLVLGTGCTSEEEERTIDKIVDGLAGSKSYDSDLPHSCVSGDGKIYVVWQDNRHDDNLKDKASYTDVFFNASSNGGKDWFSSAIQLNNADARAMNPSIACDGDTVYVAWEDERDGELDYHNIYMDVSTNGGREFLSKDIQLDADPDGSAMSLSPQVVAAGDSAYVAWFDQKNGAYDIYVQATSDRGATWFDEPTRVDADELGSAYSANPRIAADTSGNVTVVWEDRRNGKSDIYANYSSNGGRSFDAETRLDGGEAGEADSFLPRVASHGSEVWTVWHDQKDGEHLDVFLNYSSDLGQTWLAEPVRVDSDAAGTYDSLNPVVVGTDSGGAIAWQDDRSGGNDIYFRFTPDGGATWASEEVRLDTDAGGSAQSVNPVIISSGKRLAVGWMDYRDDGKNEGVNDLYYNYSGDYGVEWSSRDIRLNSSEPGITYAENLSLAYSDRDLVSIWSDGRSGHARVYFAGYKLGDGSVYVPPKGDE